MEAGKGGGGAEGSGPAEGALREEPRLGRGGALRRPQRRAGGEGRAMGGCRDPLVLFRLPQPPRWGSVSGRGESLGATAPLDKEGWEIKDKHPHTTELSHSEIKDLHPSTKALSRSEIKDLHP